MKLLTRYQTSLLGQVRYTKYAKILICLYLSGMILCKFGFPNRSKKKTQSNSTRHKRLVSNRVSSYST